MKVGGEEREILEGKMLLLISTIDNRIIIPKPSIIWTSCLRRYSHWNFFWRWLPFVGEYGRERVHCSPSFRIFLVELFQWSIELLWLRDRGRQFNRYHLHRSDRSKFNRHDGQMLFFFRRRMKAWSSSECHPSISLGTLDNFSSSCHLNICMFSSHICSFGSNCSTILFLLLLPLWFENDFAFFLFK